MKYIHLIEKLTKYQDKIKTGIADDPDVETIPVDLDEKCEAADKWLAEADVKLGDAEVAQMVPDIDPILDYSTALDKYSHLFNEKVQSDITEFAELVKSLFEMVKE